MNSLCIEPSLGLRALLAGLFVSSGHGTHPDRVLGDHELIVVRKGTLAIWEDEVRFDVPAGHALLLHAGRRHRGAQPFARDLSFYWIHFVLTGNHGQGGLCLPKFCRVARFDSVAGHFHRYLEDQEAGLLDPLRAAAGLLQILCEVGRSPLQAKGPRGSVLIGRVQAHVTRNLAGKLSTAVIARALRTNSDYLSRVFREGNGVTITEYIQRRRLTDAAGMLRDGDATVSEVALACGYSSVGHFRRMFRRLHGVTPGAYRRLMARAHVNAR